jgi:hypothetical protein
MEGHMTLAEKKAKIQHLLATNNTAVEVALTRLLARQTSDERYSHTTVHANNRGFSGRDAEFGTSLAEWINKGHSLSYRQMIYGRKMVMKYWRQLIEEADARTPGWADPVAMDDFDGVQVELDAEAALEAQAELAYMKMHGSDPF